MDCFTLPFLKQTQRSETRLMLIKGVNAYAQHAKKAPKKLLIAGDRTNSELLFLVVFFS